MKANHDSLFGQSISKYMMYYFRMTQERQKVKNIISLNHTQDKGLQTVVA
jgi:hypothetical protein